MSGPLDRQEFVTGYLAETEEHLRTANAALLAIEGAQQKDEPHPRAVRELFRALHTIKGLSAMIGVDPIVDIAHEMESILRLADRGAERLSVRAIELLLQGVRAIEQRNAAFGAGKRVPPAPSELLGDLMAIQTAPQAPVAPTARLHLEPELLAKLNAGEQLQLMRGVEASQRALRIDYIPSPDRSAQGITITRVREQLAKVGEIVKVVPVALPRDERSPGAMLFRLVLLTAASDAEVAEAAFVSVADVQSLALEPAATQPALPLGGNDPAELDAGPGLRPNSIRVEVSRLDDAMEKLSELVVSRFRLTRALEALREQGADVRELTAILDEHARRLRDLRGCITRARMVPVRDLLERVPLIVRGMSRATKKLVQLDIDAGSAELDKAVAERIFPAIVHLIRNAIDHALEAPEVRRALGKPEHGRLTVTCLQHSNSELELRVSDDGCGMDGARIARKAGRPTPRSNQELLELITQPGFSTLDQATSSSGRGMGMDIVKKIAVETLGGKLTLETTPQVGTTFTLRVPLSISIVDSFSFACGGQTFVVPVGMIEEIIDLDGIPAIATPAPTASLAVRLIERRGQPMPLLPLARLFALDADSLPAAKALVVRRSGEPFAFSIDRMCGQQEVVVRPLEDPLVQVPGISGSTDLGDGRPTLVLDLLRLSETPRQLAEVGS